MKKSQLFQTLFLAVIVLLITISCDIDLPTAPKHTGGSDWSDFSIFPDGTVTWPTGTGGGGTTGGSLFYFPTFKSVVWTGDKFVAVGSSVITSDDGSIWEMTTSPGIPLVKKAFYFDSTIYVTGGAYGYEIKTSKDANEWTLLFDKVSNEKYTDMLKKDSILFVVGCQGTSGLIMTSVNGSDWNRIILPETNIINKIIYANSQYYAFAGIGKGVYTSVDGSSWTYNSNSNDESLQDVTWFNDRFISYKKSYIGRAPEIYDYLESFDGLNFTEYTTDTTLFNPYQIKQINGKLFAYGNKFAIATSEDGVSWSHKRLGMNLDDICYDITWNGEIYVAVGKGNKFQSTDGYNWSRI